MEELLAKAIKIALAAHEGQTDKSGMPYAGHVMRVMQAGRTIEEKIAGVLHDVVEDTEWTFERLLEEGFPSHIVDALRCVTKLSDDEPYDHFIERIKPNPLARAVKINDLTDNMDIRRYKELTEWDIKRLKKYLKAYRELTVTFDKPSESTDRPRKRIFVDMDGVLVDFQSGIDRQTPEILKEYEGRIDEIPSLFAPMRPMPGAIEAMHKLQKHFDLYILSTAPWKNPTAPSDKVQWVTQYLDDVFHKRMILTHCKNLCKGDYLIDDRPKNGTKEFEGEWIEFGNEAFPDWQAVVAYLFKQNGIKETE